MNTEMRELTPDELEIVSGGLSQDVQTAIGHVICAALGPIGALVEDAAATYNYYKSVT